jgi:ubiquitin C-terminal hydrolase
METTRKDRNNRESHSEDLQKYFKSDIFYNDGMLKIRGFNNLGNTCYMNAAIQALLSSNIMNSRIYKYTQDNKDKVREYSPMLFEYVKIIYTLMYKNGEGRIDSNNRDILVPRDFKNTLSQENKTFAGYSQQDSHELITFLLDSFTEFSKEFKPEKKTDPKIKTVFTGIRKLLRDTFFGSYRQVIVCNVCKNITSNIFEHVDIILPVDRKQRIRNNQNNINNINNNLDVDQIRNQKPITIAECFDKYCSVEHFDKESKINCDKCKMKTNSSKKMALDYVPELTILTINRFEGDKKIDVPIKIYPRIELDGYLLRLISTVNHHGSTIHGGHYTAYVSRCYYDNSGSGNIIEKWYIADDSNIREIERSVVLDDPRIYLAMYERVQ